MKEYLAWH